MDWLIPIISAIIGGLFSFLCVLLTIKHENKIFKAERADREKERSKQEQEKNKEKNEVIIQNRPQFVIVDDSEPADKTLAVRLLPQGGYYQINTLLEKSDKERLTFNYPRKILDDKYWDKYSVTIKNTGNDCLGGFLHLPDKSWVNIYDDDYFNEENSYLLEFYSEMVLAPAMNSGEILKITIYYPKSMLIYKRVVFDLFMYDQKDNHWRQDNIIHEYSFNESYPISFEEYVMNFKEEIIQWHVIRRMYDENLRKGIEMQIDDSFARSIFDSKVIELGQKESEFRQFREAVKNGKVLLKS